MNNRSCRHCGGVAYRVYYRNPKTFKILPLYVCIAEQIIIREDDVGTGYGCAPNYGESNGDVYDIIPVTSTAKPVTSSSQGENDRDPSNKDKMRYSKSVDLNEDEIVSLGPEIKRRNGT